MLPDSDEVGNTLLPQDVSGGHVHYSTIIRQHVDANAAVTAVSVSEYLGRASRNSRFLSTARSSLGSGQRLPRGQPDPRELDRLGIGVAPWVVPRNR